MIRQIEEGDTKGGIIQKVSVDIIQPKGGD